MAELANTERDSLHILSGLLFSREDSRAHSFQRYCSLDEAGRRDLVFLANIHHVPLRASLALASVAEIEGVDVPSWVPEVRKKEAERIERALQVLAAVCQELEGGGFPTVVIKSLDHWPDLGNDLDLYTTGCEANIRSLMETRFDAQVASQSWGDRLACKWNFRIPGLQELIEIHVKRLGQTGEQTRMGRSLLQRRIPRTVAGHSFMVPSPEDRIVLAVLERFYRHYYFRLCDIANIVDLIRNNRIDFEQLDRDCKRAGIRLGLSAYLYVIDQYYAHYHGERLPLPAKILRRATFGVERVYAHAGFLRIPLFPQSTALYLRQFTKAVRRKDLRKSLRLSLIFPLAIAAGAKLRITGDDKGIW